MHQSRAPRVEIRAGSGDLDQPRRTAGFGNRLSGLAQAVEVVPDRFDDQGLDICATVACGHAAGKAGNGRAPVGIPLLVDHAVAHQTFLIAARWVDRGLKVDLWQCTSGHILPLSTVDRTPPLPSMSTA